MMENAIKMDHSEAPPILRNLRTSRKGLFHLNIIFCAGPLVLLFFQPRRMLLSRIDQRMNQSLKTLCHCFLFVCFVASYVLAQGKRLTRWQPLGCWSFAAGSLNDSNQQRSATVPTCAAAGIGVHKFTQGQGSKSLERRRAQP